MATTTTRLGIRKPDPTDLVSVTTDINAGADKLDIAIDRICTASTRPSTAYVGMRIYETDTNRELVCVSIGPIVWRYMSTLLVADATARAALTPVYEGMQIYRIDKDWTEFYNGSVWRVLGGGTLTVSALADITNPLTNQIAILSSDGNTYKYDGSAWFPTSIPIFTTLPGSAKIGTLAYQSVDQTLYVWKSSGWVPADPRGTMPGGDYTISGALAIGTPTLINNWIAWTGGSTPSGVSHSSGTFTVTEAGLYLINLNCRFSNATADKYCFITSAAALTPVIGKSASGSVANVGSAIGTHRFAASGQFRCYAYAGSASNVINETAGDQVTGVSIFRLGN